MPASPRDIEKNLESQADIELQQIKGIDAHGETSPPQKKAGLSAAAISQYTLLSHQSRQWYLNASRTGSRVGGRRASERGEERAL